MGGLDSSTLRPDETGDISSATAVPALVVAWHPEVARVGDRALLPQGRAELSRKAPVFHPPGGGRTAGPLADPFVSRSGVQLDVRLDGSVEIGAHRDLVIAGHPADRAEVFDAAAVERGVPLLLAGRVALVLCRVPLRGDAEDLGLVGQSEGMAALRAGVLRATLTDHPVLVRGESGSGKELVARAIHARSGRAGAAYHAVNMAAIPPTTAAAELFGHARGAFTGATEARTGWFGAADGGTLFMDEVGDTPPEVQTTLLRVLESGEIQPVGATRTRAVDVRLVAATDADLDEAIEGGRFRLPLLHRLAAVDLRVPPLRERPDDVGLLLRHFLRDELDALGASERLELACPEDKPWLSAKRVEPLLRHDWPGNVRELRNLARQVALAGANEPRVPSCPPLDAVRERVDAARPEGPPTADVALAAFEAVGFSAGAAARRLGLPKTTFYRLVEGDPRFRRADDVTDAEVREAWEACGGEVDEMVHRLRLSTRSVRQRLRGLGLG